MKKITVGLGIAFGTALLWAMHRFRAETENPLPAFLGYPKNRGVPVTQIDVLELTLEGIMDIRQQHGIAFNQSTEIHVSADLVSRFTEGDLSNGFRKFPEKPGKTRMILGVWHNTRIYHDWTPGMRGTMALIPKRIVMDPTDTSRGSSVVVIRCPA